MNQSTLSTFTRTRASILVGSVLAGLLAVTACGDDDAPPAADGGETGGSTGTGGKGSGGASTGGAKATGGTTSTGGKGGDGGSATGGQSASGGTTTDDGGTGGDADGGDADGGDEPAPWAMGSKSTGGADPAKEDRYYATKFDAAGNVYTIGYVNDAGNRKVVVAKYGQDGVLVTSGWGTNGVVTIDLNAYAGDLDNPLVAPTATNPNPKFASGEEGRDLDFQSNGKLIIAAIAEDTTANQTFNRRIIVQRLNTDGTRDDGFGDGGQAIVDWSPTPTPENTTNDSLWGIDVDAGDKIYLFGSGRSRGAAATTTDRFVTRLTASGGVDGTFANAEGTFTTDTPTSNIPASGTTTYLGLNDNARHGSALPGGGVMVSGYTNIAGRNTVIMWKLKENGERDTEFSGDGIARVTLFPNGMAEAYGAAVLGDGSFVTTGYGQVNLDLPTNLDMVSTKLTATGAVDPSYGIAGSLAIDLTGAEERGRFALALGERVLMTGAGSTTAGNKDAMLVLLEPDGTPVANFGTDGHQLYDYGTTNEEFYGAAVSRDGKWIAAAGYTAPSTATESNGIVTILPVGE